MADTRSLGARLGEDLTSALSVSVVSALLAVVALFAFVLASDPMPSGFLLGVNIAVFVPYAYERYWPVAYSGGAAAVWTLSAALVTAGLFVGVYGITLGVTSGAYAAGTAFVVTAGVQYGTAAAFGRVRRDA